MISTRFFFDTVHASSAITVQAGGAGCAAAPGEEASSGTEQNLAGAPLDTENTWSFGVYSSTTNTDPA